ncbi:metallophosphoesterase family protein [Flavobacterium sp. MAH-1]|uniref:Metallophosphoesterase family protein n=1 Tax=Flavobacterium agri TaxID=2743471 RepID=A0A7Y8Y407_9FLAO|nr:metallophosphoesterase [Flavobacterium agri]NUY82107.1 metallophosphoesterase family protein [Flavobacterium agri]NYA72131.1 metallophosphoesterase family protein [Flavobacterium agri]
MKKTIAFITDMHLFEKLPVQTDQLQHWQQVLDDVRERKVDEIVIGGDISESEHYAYFFESLKGFDGRFRIIAGNHDVVPALLHHFSNPENADSAELYYSFSDENFLYLFLDSSSNHISEAQLHWLEQKLEANHFKVLLFVHHPIYEVDTYVDRKYPLQNRETLQEMLSDQNQEVFIFCGHYHCEDETGTGAISQYETPAVSYQIKKGTDDLDAHAEYFGYRLITIDHGNISNQIVRLT